MGQETCGHESQQDMPMKAKGVGKLKAVAGGSVPQMEAMEEEPSICLWQEECAPAPQ